jgi:hypothetical protein
MTHPAFCTAFAGAQRLAGGDPAVVAVAVRRHMDHDPAAAILIFDDETAQPVEFDLRGSEGEVVARLGIIPEPPRGRGRPKLGVVPREVTLLPRHWEWLGAQPGGASVALRKLVDAARAANVGLDRRRAAQKAAHQFMTAMAGNAGGYEDALRALYAADRERFEQQTASWPADIRDYTLMLAADAF